MPPPPGIAGAAFFFGASATMASVVIMRPAIEAASCSATRTTFAGSTMPALEHVDILLGLGVKAEGLGLVGQDIADDDRALHARILGDLADRRFESPQHDIDAGLDIGILIAEFADSGLGAQKRNAAARERCLPRPPPWSRASRRRR